MLKGRQFTKNKENFVCEHCGVKTDGDGYTNHCPKCLWSLHVDIHPGDRRSLCGGLMKPVAIENKRGDHIILHKCVVCGHNKRNKINPKDDFDEIIRISKKIAEE